MIREIKFVKGGWEKYFEHAYNERFPFMPKFIQETDCISNGKNDKMSDGFDYTTIMTKDKYAKGTKIWVTCSFEDYGAPLITLTDVLRKDEQGNLKYGVCQEIVLWEKGINVWNMFDEDGRVKWNQVMSSKFPLDKGRRHEIYIELMEKYVRIIIGENDIRLRMDNLPEEVYIGITGCENINHFYNMKIETEEN